MKIHNSKDSFPKKLEGEYSFSTEIIGYNDTGIFIAFYDYSIKKWFSYSEDCGDINKTPFVWIYPPIFKLEKEYKNITKE